MQDTLEDGQTLAEGGLIVKVDDQEFHLGYSRLSSYMECPMSYKYTYVDGRRSEGSPVMRRGTAFHNTLEDMLKYKAGWGKLMPIDKAEARARHHCTENRVCPSATEEVIKSMRFFYDQLYHKLTPAMLLETAGENESAIEGEFKIYRGGVEITGRIDFASEVVKGAALTKALVAEHAGGIIHDWKFSNKPWEKDRVTHSVQPMIYQWAGEDWFEPNFGIPYLGFQYDIFNVWPDSQIQTVYIPRLDKKASDWWERQIEAFAKAIRTSIFPANPSDNVCKWCNHRAVCKPAIYQVEIDFIRAGIDALGEGEY